MKIYMLTFISVLFLAGIIFADDPDGIPKPTIQSTISEVEIRGDVGFIIRGGFGNAFNCSNGNGNIIVFKTHPLFSQLLATALTAQAASSSIVAYVEGCRAPGYYGGSMNFLHTDGGLIIKK